MIANYDEDDHSDSKGVKQQEDRTKVTGLPATEAHDDILIGGTVEQVCTPHKANHRANQDDDDHLEGISTHIYLRQNIEPQAEKLLANFVIKK